MSGKTFPFFSQTFFFGTHFRPLPPRTRFSPSFSHSQRHVTAPPLLVQLRHLEVRRALRGALLRPARPPRARPQARALAAPRALVLSLRLVRRVHGDRRRLLHAAAVEPGGEARGRGRRGVERGRGRRGRRPAAAPAAALALRRRRLLPLPRPPLPLPSAPRPRRPSPRHLGRRGARCLPPLPPAHARGPGKGLRRRRRRLRRHRRGRRRARPRGRLDPGAAPPVGRDDRGGQDGLRGAVRDPHRR